MQCTVCLDGADRSLAKKKNSGIILFKFNGGNCDYFATGLRNGFFFIWDDSNPLWTNQVWNFRGEVSVFGMFLVLYKHAGIDLTSKTQY